MDELDRKTVLALQENGRISNAQLARKFDLAASSMLERIRRLEERGILRGYRAVVDPEAIGLQLQGFVSVALDRHDVDCIGQFEEGVQEIPHVKACYHVAGRFDYLLHVAVRDLNHLERLLRNRIASMTGIGKVETFLIFSEVKKDNGWPIEEDIGTEEGKGGQDHDTEKHA